MKPGCAAQAAWNQSPLSVNDVSFDRVGRNCVTPAAQLPAPILLQLGMLGLASRLFAWRIGLKLRPLVHRLFRSRGQSRCRFVLFSKRSALGESS